jgi:hypothetical protein
MTRRTKLALSLAGAAALATIYVFLATSGTMTRFPHLGVRYYESLASAFVGGRFDVVRRSDAATLDGWALRERYWDLSIQDGRLYPYWGPVPALIGSAVLWESGVHVTDDEMTFAFALVRALAGTMILVRAKERFFDGRPWWPTWLGVLTMAFGAPVTLVFARAAVYEASLLGGQCFIVLGTALALEATAKPGRPRLSPALLAVASACWALAVGSRASQGPVCGMLVVLTLLLLVWDEARRSRRRALVVPMAAGAALLGAYNRARFGSIWDAGLERQLTVGPFHSGVRFILPNLYAYMAKPPRFGSDFPFLRVGAWDGFWLWSVWPQIALASGDVWFEQNVGFLWSTPFYAFSVVALAALLGWATRAIARRSMTVVAPSAALGWLVASSLAMAFVGLFPCLLAYCSTTRYLADGASGLAISATIGLSILASKPRRLVGARWGLPALAVGLVAASLVVNFAFWIEGPYGGFLRTTNPLLLRELAHPFTRAPRL